jgi:hypothetical protein
MYDAIILKPWVPVMSEYEKSKTARRVAAVTYLLVLGFILGGTYLSQRQKQAAETSNLTPQQSVAMPD